MSLRVSSWLRNLSLLLLLVIAACAAGLWWWKAEIVQPLSIDEPKLFTIEQGTSAYGIIQHLQQRNWWQGNGFAARLFVRVMVTPSTIKAGTYQLTPSMQLNDVYTLIASGSEFQFDVRLVEGLTLKQWLDVLRSHPYLHNDLDDATLHNLLQGWTLSDEKPQQLEGLLLADTYHVTANTAASNVIRRAMQSMQAFLTEQWLKRSELVPLATPYEALVLASIIEKETALASERPMIAGVFVNRLNDNMRLQTDPTVIYGLGDSFDGNLTRAHLRQATDYNTYVIKGLPPTPISMVGREAIIAALQPTPTDAYYFVSRGDGSHHFSTTLEEHNRAVRKYQLNHADIELP